MRTKHKILFSNAQSMDEINDQSIDLVVTSPPYPMIEMWDEIFAKQDPSITDALKLNDGNHAFELMHRQLDQVWNELYRITKPGAIVCINIGDATRTIQSEFKLYSNHSRILNHCLKLGFNNLPNILWRKQTNAPNKFMGSGMLAPGAYVTLEHEYILIFRKGNKRLFSTKEESQNRSESAFFWEERNVWFSDVWDLKGRKQKLGNKKSRDRSGAFPFELAYHLINMFSVKGHYVLDPFLGTGTTTITALAAGRNSIGYEIDENLSKTIASIFNDNLLNDLNNYIRKRILNHLAFVETRKSRKGQDAFKHINIYYDFPVMTKQERKIILNFLESIDTVNNNLIIADYITEPVLDTYSKESLFAIA
ncbi:MAG: site-specific DNA-methyltransferase [Chlorobi bacterium]|nr:site-specific DNA-methyltransferase [Chlorobiota bacterium]